ncbi:MAG: hypothetical protein V4719_02850 [Planctomycetota bacterium]
MPNPPPEVVPPNPVEITQPERQIDLHDVDPKPPTPNPVVPMDDDDFGDVSPENQPLEERDA